jgi:hypothetical protein
MSVKNPLEQAQKLEEQIKRLQEKQRNYIERAQKELGQYLMEQWEIEDIDQAKEVIAALRGEARNYFKTDVKKETTKVEVLTGRNG